MRYMMFIKHTEEQRKAAIPPSLFEEMGRFIEEMSRSGNFVAAGGLQPSSAGARVRLEKGRITTTDGPFAESKEMVGGYALVDAASHEEAVTLAQRFMEIHLKHWPTFEGECELRPLEEEAQPAPSA